MIYAVCFLALLASTAVNAFQMSSVYQSRAMNLQMAEKSKALPFLPEPKNLKGYAGDAGFDPVGFSNLLDIRWLRESELKHCRIAMLGVVGWIVSEFVQLPGEIHAVSPVAAHDVAVKSGALYQVLLWTSILEIFSTKAIIETLQGSGREPGDFKFDPLKFSEGKSAAVKADYALKELKNGRLAMLAFGGIVTQAVLTGHGFPYAN
eukprot:gene12595-13786_t